MNCQLYVFIPPYRRLGQKKQRLCNKQLRDEEYVKLPINNC
jgi:hypothetical protein